MPDTPTALAIFVLLVLPGVLFVFAAEARLGVTNDSQGDRIFRFLAAGALLNVLWLWGTLRFVGYFDDLGFPDWDWEWPTAAILLAILVGLVGVSIAAGWLAVRLPVIGRPLSSVVLGYRPDEASSWDRIIAEASESANPRVMLVRTTEGRYLAGIWGDVEGQQSLASTFDPESRARDLYFAASITIDGETAEVLSGSVGPSLLVRGSSIESIELI